MSLNTTPAALRLHIGFFGRRNAGKSSVMNAVAAQDLSIISKQKGTTTDPVYKTMELLPLGPVMLIDTPGIDDEGPLGLLRVKKTNQVLDKTDIALVIIDALEGPAKEDVELIEKIQKKEIPYLIVFNKEDLLAKEEFPCQEEKTEKQKMYQFFHRMGIGAEKLLWISTVSRQGIEALKNRLGNLMGQEENQRKLVQDLLLPGDFVILVVPIDKAAPKGRLILPQQQTIRDILEVGATAVVVRDKEYRETLIRLGKRPQLVITDSQVFARISAETPTDIPLTSFSILFARYKGILYPAVSGARTLEKLVDGDKILISEGCTHHRQCEDIGTVKLPGWINRYTGKKLDFAFTSGTEFPEDLKPYKLIVHCGGCMLNDKEMGCRLRYAQEQEIPMTNYGILIAYMQGILERCIGMLGKPTG